MQDLYHQQYEGSFASGKSRKDPVKALDNSVQGLGS